jgi:hypothetical protein
MKNLARVGLLFTFLLSAPLFAAVTMIPEVTPNNPNYQKLVDILQSSLDSANQARTSYYSQRYLNISFRGVTGGLCYTDNGQSLTNALDTVVVLNGKYFLLPTGFTSADNF